MSEANIKNLLARVANDPALQAKISHLKESSSEEFIKALADLSAETSYPAPEEEIRSYFQHLASLEISDSELADSIVGGTHYGPRNKDAPPMTEEQKQAFIDTGIDILKAITFPGYTIINKLS
jgi:hypothetical protein